MFSTTMRRSPLPKLRVTYWTRIPSSPHIPHRLGALLDPGSDEDDFPRGSDLDDAAGRLARDRFASDDVLPLASLRIALPLDNLAREDDVFDVEDADFVIVQFIGCVKGYSRV